MQEVARTWYCRTVRWYCGALVLAMLLRVSSVLAQGETNVEARRLFDLAVQQMALGDWEEGCGNLEQSVRLEPTPGAYLNLGVCSEEFGRFREAAERYRMALALAPGYPKAETALDRLPKLTITLSQPVPGLTLELDGAPATLGSQLVDKGRHELKAFAPGYETRVVVIDFTGQAHLLHLTLGKRQMPELATAASGSAETTTRRPETAPSDDLGPRASEDTLGYVALVIGAVGLAAGGTLGVLVLKDVDESNSHCRLPGGTCDAEGVRLRTRASALQLAGFVAAGVGLASAGIGAWVLWSPPTDASGALLSVQGTF